MKIGYRYKGEITRDGQSKKIFDHTQSFEIREIGLNNWIFLGFPVFLRFFFPIIFEKKGGEQRRLRRGEGRERSRDEDEKGKKRRRKEEREVHFFVCSGASPCVVIDT